MRKWKPVTEMYIGSPLANGQGCDEPYDPAFKERFNDGQILNGRGSQGGGSKTPHQRVQTTTGHKLQGGYPLKGSYPKKSQQVRD